MELENQVCPLNFSRELIQLGVSRESYHHWKGEGFYDEHKESKYVLNPKTAASHGLFFPAFTVAELSLMLGNGFLSWRFKSPTAKREPRWIATVINKNEKPDGRNITTTPDFDMYADTQAKVLAMLLIACIRIDFIEVKDINKRLKES